MTHDGFGNLTDKTQTPQGPAPTLSVTVNAATNQLNGCNYDANGSMTAPPGLSSAIYDEENRMVTASPISGGTESYAYGPDKCGVWKLRPGGNSGTETSNPSVQRDLTG